MLLHILGSNIPHHNRTLLAFFAEQIAPTMAEKPQFWVVGGEALAAEFPALSIKTFPTKMALAKALVVKNRQNLTACYFFHGQYNAPLWLAILVGLLPAERCVWHIWGADLYQDSQSLAFRLFYPLRRLAQKRLKTVFGTQGDLDYFAKIQPKSDRLLLYFPTKMPELMLNDAAKIRTSPFRVLLGNSGDPSNQHLAGLADLHRQLGDQLQVMIPMGYPADNSAYIDAVAERGEQLFGKNCEVWREVVPFTNYWENLTACQLGYFPFTRQQGIGTLCLLIALNIPFALSRDNPFCVDLIAEKVPFLYCDELSFAQIATVQQQLMAMDKSQIRFFPPHYRQLWLARLNALTTSG